MAAAGSRSRSGSGSEGGVGFVVGVGVASLEWWQGVHRFCFGLAGYVQISTGHEFVGVSIEGLWALVGNGAVVFGGAGFVLDRGLWWIIGVISFFHHLGLKVRRASSSHDDIRVLNLRNLFLED